MKIKFFLQLLFLFVPVFVFAQTSGPISDSATVGGRIQPALIPIIIFNVNEANITTSSVEILWETNISAFTKLTYGKTTSYSLGSYQESAESLFHSTTLTGLEPGTKYYYKIFAWHGSQIGEVTLLEFTTTVDTPPFNVTVESSTAVIEGTGPPGGTVTLIILRGSDEEIKVTVNVDSSGNWSYETPDLDGDDYDVIAFASVNGIDSVDSSPESFTIDTQTLDPPDLEPVVEGKSAYIRGTGPPNSKIHLMILKGNNEVFTVTRETDSDGDWNYPTPDLEPGTYNAYAYATRDGLTSYDSKKRTFEIQEEELEPVVLLAVGLEKRGYISGTGPPEGTLVINITRAGEVVQVVSVLIDANGNWNYTTAELPASNDYEVVAFATLDDRTTPQSNRSSFVIVEEGKLEPPEFIVEVLDNNRAKISGVFPALGVELPGGTGPPGGVVYLTLRSFGEEFLTVPVRVDGNGYWEYETDELDPSMYEAIARAVLEGVESPFSQLRNFDIADSFTEVGHFTPEPTVSITPGVGRVVVQGTGPNVGVVEIILWQGEKENEIDRLIVSIDATGRWSYVSSDLMPGEYVMGVQILLRGEEYRTFGEVVFVIPEQSGFIEGIREAAVPIVLLASLAALVPVITVSGSLGGFLAAFANIIAWILAYFNVKQRGLVYDRRDGSPLALAKVELYDGDGNKVEQGRTDKYGMFSFTAHKGDYTLRIRKGKFHMVSSAEENASPIGYDRSYYKNQKIHLDKKDHVIPSVPMMKDTPMSRVEKTLHFKETHLVVHTICLVAIAITVLLSIINPSVESAVLVTVASVPYLLFKANVARPIFGKVRLGELGKLSGVGDISHMIPLSGQKVFINYLRNGTMRAMARTFQDGEYAFVLTPGTYSVETKLDNGKSIQKTFEVKHTKWAGQDIQIPR